MEVLNMKQGIDIFESGTIRTSPTISKLSYNVYTFYGIPISNFLERQAIELGTNEDEIKSEIWSEIKAKEKEISFYDEEIRILNKKKEKAKEQIKEFKQAIANGVLNEFNQNMIKAVGELTRHAKKEKAKKEKNHRYKIKKMPIDEVFKICANCNVTPKMTLARIEYSMLNDCFDEKCMKYVK